MQNGAVLTSRQPKSVAAAVKEGDISFRRHQMKYRVLRHEVWIQTVIVEADDPQQAIEAVRTDEPDCVLDEDGPEFSHMLSSNTWTAEVEEEEGD
jgi:hypothetical protein